MRGARAVAVVPLFVVAIGGVALAQPQPPPAYPPAPAPPPPPPKHGPLFIPYFGFESHMGEGSDTLGVGFGLGAIAGGRVNQRLSINGELTINVLNPKNAPDDTLMFEGDLALSPLFHVPLAFGEVVIGPKLGVFGASWTATGFKRTATGYAFGLNGGAFFAVSPMLSVGALLNFTFRDAQEVCTTLGTLPESCDDTTDFTSEKVFAGNLALLF